MCVWKQSNLAEALLRFEEELTEPYHNFDCMTLLRTFLTILGPSKMEPRRYRAMDVVWPV